MYNTKCAIADDFKGAPSTHWARWLQGAGQLEPGDSTVRLVTHGARAGQYSDAQLDDYHTSLPDLENPPGLKRRWLWRPPLRMQVRARASGGSLVGTAGFGFWNDPFTLSGGVTALPEAVWFFYASPPSNMALVPGVPGWGWQAAVVHTARADVVLAALPTAVTVLWARLTGRIRLAARCVQRLSGACVAPLRLDWIEWHTFELDWQPDVAVFSVDGATVLRAPNPPRGPLGFVTWVDNQYAIATPRAQFRFGTLDAPEKQWLELDWVCIEGRNMGTEHTDCNGELPPLVAKGIEEFNRGEFYEQHETLETAWRAEPRPVRKLYQGILQVGVACYHLERGNRTGALRLLERGLRKLRPFAPACLGIDVARLIADAERLHGQMQSVGPDHLIQLDRALFPRIILIDRIDKSPLSTHHAAPR